MAGDNINRPPDADEYGGNDLPSHDADNLPESSFADMLEEAAAAQGRELSDEERAKMRDGMTQLEDMFNRTRDADWKAEAGGWAKNSARSGIRRMAYSLLLSFTFNDEYDKQRMLNRLERGENIGCFHFFFGEEFSLGFVLRVLLLIAFFGGIAVYAWQQGFIG